MNKFERDFNYDDVILRNITLGVIKELYRKVRWVNTWDDKKKLVTVPISYSLMGSERFLMDAFVDDITGGRADFNIDDIPRGHIKLDSAIVKRNEISNPNVYMQFYEEKNGFISKKSGKFRVLPIQVSYSLKIELDTEIDLFKCKQSLWDWIEAYKYFYITHNSFRVDCVMNFPDSYQDEISRESQSVGSSKDDTKKFIELNFDVNSFYPIPPKEHKPIINNCNKVLFKGTTFKLENIQKKRVFVGGCINKKK